MAEKEAAVCLLLALLVDDEDEKLLAQLKLPNSWPNSNCQLQSVSHFKNSEITEIDHAVPKCWQDIANRTNTSILPKCWPTFLNKFEITWIVGFVGT